MSSTFGSFTTVRLGIYAAQKGLDVTGNNITNINTTGYTRQRLDQVSLVTSAADRTYSPYKTRIGQGVLTTGVSQLRDPGLDLSNLPSLTSVYERVTGMHVYERQPYAGQLVFAAFSGGHQDAITKGMKWRAEHGGGRWTVPYLAIDPEDIGRTYESDVIRINSQSGKGGIGHVLESHFGYDLPAAMREDFSYTVKRLSDQEHREMQADDILAIFMENYVNNFDPLDVVEAHFRQENGIIATITVFNGGREEQVFTAQGNGRLDAVSNALKENLGYRYSIIKYQEHAIEQGSNAKAIAYVGIRTPEGQVSWGAGTHDDIMAASVNALVSAINRLGK